MTTDINIFEYATRTKARYASPVGELTTEQLWDLPLIIKDEKASNRPEKATLNSVARTINAELKAITEDNFVSVSRDPRKPALENALAVVKYIIAYKQEQEKAALTRANKAARRAELMEALSIRQKADLTTKSHDELMAELNALED